jgi:enoyl-CoA hydratase/carnithine racemase
LVWWLCRLVGVERAVRMIVTGEPISAKEAMAAGWYTHCLSQKRPSLFFSLR